MKIWTPEEEAQRLAARFVGVNQARFARENAVPGGPSMLSQHIKGRRPLNMDAALAYAKGFAVPLAEISPRLDAQARQATAIGEFFRDGTPIPPSPDPHRLKGPVAHDLSQARRIVDLPRLEWGDLMQEQLPGRFELVLRDDALGDQGRKGEIGQFATDVAPIEGRGVLFADREGNAYVRIFQVRTVGRWAGVSANPQAYGVLDSEADGLRLLAVMVGVKWA